MKKGLMIVNNKVEDGEALFTRALLIRAGYEIKTATLESDTNLKTAYGLSFKADALIEEVDFDGFDFLVVPGGSHVFDWFEKKERLDEVIKHFNEQEKLLALICAAPLFLKNLNILPNKKFTIFSGLEEKLAEGTYLIDAKVVTDGNLITARSAGVIYDFVFAILNYFNDDKKLKKLQESIIY